MLPDFSTATLGGLFLSSFLASTLLPGGSEAVLVGLAAASAAPPASLLIVATVGNTLGGMTSWGIGRWLRYRYPGRALSGEGAQRALKWTERNGGPILLLAWLPVIGDPLCLAAGWLRIHPVPAMLYIAIGKAARYGILLAAVDAVLRANG